MPFEILSSAGNDAARWTALLGKLPPELCDIHFTPEYGRIYRESYGFVPFLAVYSDAWGFVLQPFVRRPLGRLPFLVSSQDRHGFSDIANPYGYGGPVTDQRDGAKASALYGSFAKSFAAWCEKESIASEFSSLHPFMADRQRALLGGVITPQHMKDVVFIDLEPDQAAFHASLRKGHRSSISTAQRGGVEVKKVEASADNLGRFATMYEETMVRRDAAERWYVSDNFFAQCMAQLGDARSSLLFAYVGGELESGCLLIHDFSTAYYHFAGTFAKHPALGVNNLMVFEAANLARSMGYKRLHLGGGVTSDTDDTLLRFKAGFSDLRAPLYSYFCVRSKGVYDALCERKSAHEIATTGSESLSDFLPAYRR